MGLIFGRKFVLVSRGGAYVGVLIFLGLIYMILWYLIKFSLCYNIEINFVIPEQVVKFSCNPANPSKVIII